MVDKDLKAPCNARWDRAFAKDNPTKRVGSDQDATNRNAVIVIEHLIQASNVAHTMQHWHVQRKWNECLFKECYGAYLEGRAEQNPAEGWYQGELRFFDYYVSFHWRKRLKECGVYGVSSDEYLNYALANFLEWESRGQEVVEQMLGCEAF